MYAHIQQEGDQRRVPTKSNSLLLQGIWGRWGWGACWYDNTILLLSLTTVNAQWGETICLPRLPLFWNLTRSNLSSIKLETFWSFTTMLKRTNCWWMNGTLVVYQYLLILIYQVTSTTKDRFGEEFPGIVPCWAIKSCNIQLLAGWSLWNCKP